MPGCKKGDIAIYTGRDVAHRGRLVTCVEAINFPGIDLAWITDPSLPLAHGGELALAVYDRALTPLRDQPGADETLAWKPVPQPMTERQEA